MESLESPLDVLSRAATMMQHCNYPTSDSDSFESPSTASGGESEGDRDRTLSPESAPPPPRPAAKQLPTAKWRRERRSTRQPDYKPRENGGKTLRSQSFNERRTVAPLRPAAAPHSDGESPDEERALPALPTLHAGAHARGAPPEYPSEAPIDMRLKARPVPPPYPGLLPAQPANPARTTVITLLQDAPATGSMSMCDPVIDEHFRRSLGDDYMTLFAKKTPSDPANKKNTKDRGSSPIMFPSDPCTNFLEDKKTQSTSQRAEKIDEKQNTLVTNPEAKDNVEKQNSTKIQNGVGKQNGAGSKIDSVICEDVEMELDSASSSVDDHFAKALGDTWRKLQVSKHLPQQKEEGGDKMRRGVVI